MRKSAETERFQRFPTKKFNQWGRKVPPVIQSSEKIFDFSRFRFELFEGRRNLQDTVQRNFSVHTNWLALRGQTICWSKTTYVRSSCWSNQIKLKTPIVINFLLICKEFLLILLKFDIQNWKVTCVFFLTLDIASENVEIDWQKLRNVLPVQNGHT